jgi:putative ABC transport system ATP-binding protein
MTTDNSIRVVGLVVDHHTADGTVRALDCHALSVDGGSSVAVTGPSGCGKSTLLGLLAGLASPTQGSVTIGGTEISTLSDPARAEFRKSAIGVVYQADNLLPFLTVTENIGLQLSLCGGDNSPGGAASANGRVHELLDRLGLEGLGDRLPDELSGGQRQRVAVARAVVHQPSVILADEPTGALDAANAHGVVKLLTELHRDLGATLVLVTHDPTVAGLLQRTVLLRDGSVVDDTEPSRAG